MIDSFDRMGFLWFRLKNWLHIRREHQSYSKTQQGLALLIEGRYKKAEKYLIAGVNQSIDPLINYLSAARAAQAQAAFDRRDHYIQKAYEVAPKARLAIGITQAELSWISINWNRLARHLRIYGKLHRVIRVYFPCWKKYMCAWLTGKICRICYPICAGQKY